MNRTPTRAGICSLLLFLMVILSGSSVQADITSGLVGWWKLDETSGTVAVDSSIYHNNGTLQNISDPSTATSGWTTGRLGGALRFDSSDDYVTTDTVPVSGYPLTFAAWFQTSKTYALAGFMLRAASTIDPDYFVDIHIDATGAGLGVAQGVGMSIRCGNASTQNNAVSPLAYNDGNWHHAVGVALAANNIKVYVDGVDVGITDSKNPGGFPIMNNVSIGASRRISISGYFQGKVDDVRIYNRALTAGEVLDLYNYGRVRIGGGAKINGLRIN